MLLSRSPIGPGTVAEIASFGESNAALPVPYKTYSPDTVWAPATDYPYVPGFARPYYGRYAFHDPAYMNPRYQHVPHWRPFY